MMKSNSPEVFSGREQRLPSFLTMRKISFISPFLSIVLTEDQVRHQVQRRRVRKGGGIIIPEEAARRGEGVLDLVDLLLRYGSDADKPRRPGIGDGLVDEVGVGVDVAILHISALYEHRLGGRLEADRIQLRQHGGAERLVTGG